MLLAATCLTLAFAGGVFWEGELVAWTDLLDPALLARVVWSGVPYALLVLLILGSHEMGHYLACRYYGIPATLPFFLPGPPPLGSFGAVIRIRGIIPHRKALFDVAAAGPLAGFAVALPVFVIGLATAETYTGPPQEAGLSVGVPLLGHLVEPFLAGEGPLRIDGIIGAGWVGMLVTSLNLFPVGQLDGGHAAYALSRSVHLWFTRLTLVALFGVVVFQILVYQTPLYLVWFAILLWMRDRHPRLADEEATLGPGRKLIALLLLVMFLLCFIPAPIVFR